MDKLREQRDYGEALALIATLRPVVDAFFDKVMVLDPDEKVRGAHLALIDEVLRELLRHRGLQRDCDGIKHVRRFVRLGQSQPCAAAG